MNAPADRAEIEATLGGDETTPARVLFVINALDAGGAERQLITLAAGLDRSRFSPEVAVLAAGGRLEPELAAHRVPVRPFPRRGRFSFSFLPALARHARGFDVVHAWLTPGVFYGLLAGRLARVPVLVGSERGSAYSHPSRLHGALFGLEARLLSGCTGVITNSRAGAAFASSRGVSAERLHIVYNALPTPWPPPLRSRDEVRAELGLRADASVILMAASLQPKKDHETLLRAVCAMAAGGLEPELVLAGGGPLHGEIARLARELGVGARVHLLGDRPDVADLLNAADVAVLSSKEREGCPNFLMEAMSLGVPVVATEAGGTREIVRDGRTGLVVPRRDAAQLARALERMLEEEGTRRELAARARREAADRFANTRMIREFEDLYSQWLDRARACRQVVVEPRVPRAGRAAA